MKRFVLLCVVLLLLFGGCSEKKETGQGGDKAAKSHSQQAVPPVADQEIVEVKEKMFVAQTNDIYLNPDDYLGKTIKYEGLIESFYSKEENKTCYNVIRYGPGCCGYDENCGFEVRWDGEFPKDDTWVEVIGVLNWHEVDGKGVLHLDLSSLNLPSKKGAETVYQ